MAVGAAMAVLFLLPTKFFIAATFCATTVMAAAAYSQGGFGGLRRTRAASIAIGAAVAVGLYFVFYGGNAAINALQFPGLGHPSESSIYSLIASPSNPLPLQVAVLGFDSVGYESYFRGTLQQRLQPRLGFGAAPAVAAFDASLHLLTFNPLWVATTFVADLAWGFTYRYGQGLGASLTSHLLWDVGIFLLRPIT